MVIDQPDLRRCYEDVLDAEPGHWAAVLHGWAAGVSDLLAALEPLRRKEIPPATPDVDTTWWYRDARYALYALSRISDFLIEQGCPPGDADHILGVTGGRMLDRRVLDT